MLTFATLDASQASEVEDLNALAGRRVLHNVPASSDPVIAQGTHAKRRAAAVTNARACADAQPAIAAALLCVDSAEGLAWVGVGRTNEGTKRPQRVCTYRIL